MSGTNATRWSRASESSSDNHGARPVTGHEWRAAVTVSSGFEADLAIARLEAAGIRAVRDDNDTVGIFGPGFQGPTARGVTVRVPAEVLDKARAVLRSVD